MKKIIIIDDDFAFLELTQRFIKKNGFDAVTYSNWQLAEEFIKTNPVDLVLVDLYLPQISGIQIIHEIKKINVDIPILMITAHSSIETAIDAVKAGAEDYIQKPCPNSEILFKIQKVFESIDKKFEIKKLKQTINNQFSFKNLITKDEETKKIFHLAQTSADLDVTVLITGETGTGKEVLSKTIHTSGIRSAEPFVVFNCATINENLIESELFGHKKGSFTGAHIDKKGLCETVGKGTLFIDEIGELSLEVQKKLLRLIQEREFEKLGSTQVQKFHARLIAATNCNLKDMVKKNTFREDLFYRINVFPIHLKPLRERPLDIIDIAEIFLKNFNIKYSKEITSFSQKTIETMLKYKWPGNIRELEHFVERQVLLTLGTVIDKHDILLSEEDLASDVSISDYNEFIQKKEAEYLYNLLNQCKGSIDKAASVANIHRKTLYLKLKEHNMDKNIFK